MGLAYIGRSPIIKFSKKVEIVVDFVGESSKLSHKCKSEWNDSHVVTNR